MHIMRTVSSFSLVALAGITAVVACGGSNEPAKAPESTSAKVEQPVTEPAGATAPDMPAAPPAAKQATMAELQAKGLAGSFEAMNAHDAKKIAAMYAEGAVMKSPGSPDVTGRAAIEKDMSGLFLAFPDMKIAPNFVFTKGDVSIVQYAMTGTHKGDFGPIKATNKPTGWQGVTVMWWNADGQVKEEHMYWDMGTMLSQVGVSKQKAPGIPTLATKAETFMSNGSEVENKNPMALKAFYGAFEAKKGADFTGLMTDNTEWQDNTMATPSKGSKDAKKVFDSMMAGYPDAKMAVNNQWGIGDFVITEETFSGTNKGSFMGMKPTKKVVALQSLDIIMMKDGKVAKGWSFGNSMQAAEQLGMLPKPAAPAAAPATKPATPAAPAAPKK
jgi:steroid delta-isomerase-like uncharacterized protein